MNEVFRKFVYKQSIVVFRKKTMALTNNDILKKLRVH